jgi:hypothetical protein
VSGFIFLQNSLPFADAGVYLFRFLSAVVQTDVCASARFWVLAYSIKLLNISDFTK